MLASVGPGMRAQAIETRHQLETLMQARNPQ
jgi:hypothetical protein